MCVDEEGVGGVGGDKSGDGERMGEENRFRSFLTVFIRQSEELNFQRNVIFRGIGKSVMMYEFVKPFNF